MRLNLNTELDIDYYQVNQSYPKLPPAKPDHLGVYVLLLKGGFTCIKCHCSSISLLSDERLYGMRACCDKGHVVCISVVSLASIP